MALALVTAFKDITRRNKVLTVTGTVSGSYVPGGIPVDFSTVTNPKFLANGKVSSNPKRAVVINSPVGYTGELILGATIKTGLLKVYTSGGAELPAAAFPAALIADPFLFELTGPLGAF